MTRVITSVIAVICIVTVAFAADFASDDNVNTCGESKVPTGFIVYGKPILHGTYPWIVALSDRTFFPARFFCGGTLISSTFVITGKQSESKLIASILNMISI